LYPQPPLHAPTAPPCASYEVSFTTQKALLRWGCIAYRLQTISEDLNRDGEAKNNYFSGLAGARRGQRKVLHCIIWLDHTEQKR